MRIGAGQGDLSVPVASHAYAKVAACGFRAVWLMRCGAAVAACRDTEFGHFDFPTPVAS